MLRCGGGSGERWRGTGRGYMAEIALFFYGLLATFVLSGAQRNVKLARPHPPLLTYLGYVLCGASGGTSAILFGYAAAKSLGYPI